jgi:hypothetical protein
MLLVDMFFDDTRLLVMLSMAQMYGETHMNAALVLQGDSLLCSLGPRCVRSKKRALCVSNSFFAGNDKHAREPGVLERRVVARSTTTSAALQRVGRR